MLSSTDDRVRRNTSDKINQRITRKTERDIVRCTSAGRAAIDRRLAELDEEWDIERCLETMAPTFTLTGLLLSVTHSRKWLLVPAVVQGFFLQHALQGWCPPVPLLRRLGFRTMKEIDEERYALKALRGDFTDVSAASDVSADSRVGDALAAVRA